MERDEYRFRRELTGIHINLDEHAIEFEDRHGTIGRLVFGQEVVLYEGQPLLLAPPDHPRGGTTSTTSVEASTRTDQPSRPAATPRPSHRPSPPSPHEQA